MTQAFNLSQFANNLDPNGRIDAADGLVNAVPVGNGGTGATTQAAAQTNLNVPSRTGANASGTWDISISGNAANAATANRANSAATADNGGVTSVNGQTGAVTIPAATGTVTSVATGNGLSGGTITSSGTLSISCPGFLSVGSYINGGAVYGEIFPTANQGAVYGGNVLHITNNVQFAGDTLPGSWMWMSCTTSPGTGGSVYGGLLCRVA